MKDETVKLLEWWSLFLNIFVIILTILLGILPTQRRQEETLKKCLSATSSVSAKIEHLCEQLSPSSGVCSEHQQQRKLSGGHSPQGDIHPRTSL